MGVLYNSAVVTGWGAIAAVSTFIMMTRKSKISSVPPTDYIFNSALYTRGNPNKAPITQDICTREVPLVSIRPELLKNEGKLTEAFCAGVWSGVGYAYQRRYLEKKYRADPFTKDHLWDRKHLATATYEVGTKITDHFEVVSKTPQSIIVRCGDSPRVQDPRASDGLFEMTAEVRKDEGVAVLGLKSLFFNSLNGQEMPDTAPMPWHVQWLHQMYDKVLMESALRNITKRKTAAF